MKLRRIVGCVSVTQGDRGLEVRYAALTHLPIVAVLSGIRDRTQLAQHHPNVIVNPLEAALGYIALDYIWNHRSLSAIISEQFAP